MQTQPWTLREPGPAGPADVAPPELTSPELRAVVSPAARLRDRYDQATWTEGPTWWAAERSLVFSDVAGRRVLQWHEDGSVTTVLDPSEFTNGNAVDPDGCLVHCEHGRRAISRTRPGAATEVLVDRFEGRRLNSPNDLPVARDGSIWFTDPCSA